MAVYYGLPARPHDPRARRGAIGCADARFAMDEHAILPHLRGPFGFLRVVPEEVRTVLAAGGLSLPRPQLIYLEDENATPLRGYPVLLSERLQALREALVQLVIAEEAWQVAIFRRQPTDRRAHAQAWERYRKHLARAVENTTISSHGRQFPELFWLYHSLDLAALLKEIPRRITRADPDLGRTRGDEIKYRVYERFVDRVKATVYDEVQRLAADTEEIEEELFPTLLTRMVDNVLILTEDHIGPNLAELTSYFAGQLRLDGRDFRRRLESLERWHEEELRTDPTLAPIAEHLLGGTIERPRDLFIRTGYVTFLSHRPTYDAKAFLSPEGVQVWEQLLVKLKEFELLHALRRAIVPVERLGDKLMSRRGALGRTLVGTRDARLSETTRPADFTAPWVVDPLVHRFGMIYDISDFSEVVSVLRRAGSEIQDDSFRKMFRFQRRVNRHAAAQRLQLEKYLGDGAFFSSRRALRMLIAAIHVQRLYRQALAEGFPFDRGMRVALNYGQYRLIPIHVGATGTDRYEFFGHGLVELSRLSTGKSTREIAELKTMLTSLGYREEVVQRFFAPLAEKNLDLVDRQAESRQFYSYINRNGNLVNEGMVATAAFLEQLDHENQFAHLFRVREDDRRYVAFEAPDSLGGRNAPTLFVGLRKLGIASLKGLDRLAVYEIVDLGRPETANLEPLHGPGLLAAAERELAATLHEDRTSVEW